MVTVAAIVCTFFVLTFLAWRRYLWASKREHDNADACPYSLTDRFGERHLVKVPHQAGIRWLSDVFSRSAARYPHLIALQIPHTREALTFAELDSGAEKVAAAISRYLNGPDQVVAVAMSQDNWQIVACHLGILRAGGTVMFLDTTLPDALITHMLNDARPVLVLTRGTSAFRDLPTLDVLELPSVLPSRRQPTWLDDPTERLATIFYTSGTTGMPKGVECPHAGYVNLALSYADYFDLVPGMDATTLVSSLGYDGSISEMYSAWVSGCAVVMLTKEQVRSGPDLVPLLREAEVTVLFCPPVLLTTLTQNPENDLPYPICRYIVPAGEAFPAALVEPWTRARRQIINTYGPTEASTDTSRQTLRPGEPITIGSPFPNVTYAILEVDQLTPLPHGQVGELCIGGVHVARGYRNLPEQTAKKFIEHPKFGRLYRTGDKCKIDIRTQRVEFLGRIDAQLKVRGHRVETQAVEDILQTQFSEIEAAVLDYQNEALVAFISAPSIATGEISVVAPAPAEWAEQVTSVLAKQLPEPSVPTSIYLVEKFAMSAVSGKIDRKRLPKLSQSVAKPLQARGQGAADNVTKAAADARLDPSCEAVLAICNDLFETRIGPDDGFTEAGGHSILIARLAQRLQADGWQVSVRALLSDCNTARKVSNQPRRIGAVDAFPVINTPGHAKSPNRDEAAAQVLSVPVFTTLQVLFAASSILPALVAIFAVFGLFDIGQFLATASLTAFVLVGLALYLIGLVSPFVVLPMVMIARFLMGGDFRKNNITPGVYPKWSRMHLRIWCIGRLESMVLLSLGAMYRSAPLMSFVLRQLGANVGRNVQCASDAYLSGPLDLLTVEDDVAIQTGAYISTAVWSGQNLHIGPIRLEKGCKIGMRAAVGGNVRVGAGTWVTPFTAALSDIGAYEIWEGSPARRTGAYTELQRTTATSVYKQPIWLLEALNISMQIVVSFCISALPSIVILWLARDFIPAGAAEAIGDSAAGLPADYFKTTPLVQIVASLALYAIITNWLTVIVVSLLGCLFIRFTATSPGLYPAYGLKAALLKYRVAQMNVIQGTWTWTLTGQYLRALAGLHFPRVGASECDVMFNLVPEAASADTQVFWSNGCFTNMLDIGANYVTLRQLDMPRNFFAGNNCVAESGNLPSNFMLGVSTPASDVRFRRQMLTRLGEPITVAGNPPVKFASASFEAENRAHKSPSFALFLTRVCLNDVFSIGLLRVTEMLLFAVLYICLIRWGLGEIAGAVVGFALTEISMIVMSVSVKRVLVGNNWGTQHSTPFWSWRHFSYFFAQDCFFIWCRGPLAFCAGTILSNSILRWMGCEIGRHTIVMEPMQCSDWNAVRFGRDCVVNGFLQFHSFENMTLKVKQTHLGDGCVVAFGATVMGGARIERDTTLLPLSLVLKEMALSTAIYEGSPVELARGDMLVAIKAIRQESDVARSVIATAASSQ